MICAWSSVCKNYTNLKSIKTPTFILSILTVNMVMNDCELTVSVVVTNELSTAIHICLQVPPLFDETRRSHLKKTVFIIFLNAGRQRSVFGPMFI